MPDAGVEVAVVVAAALVLWSLVSARLERWNISAPIAFVFVGFVVTSEHINLIEPALGSAAVRQIAELTLAVVLFADASTVELGKLRRDAAIPARLLGLGLPLTIALGTLAAYLLLPETSWWVCAVIGAAVAPTDAALGAAIIEDERVPLKIRRVLNVESGLNDGIATPFVNFFLAAAVAGSALAASKGSPLRELAVGVVAGVVLGGGGGWAMAHARRLGLSSPAYRAIGAAALSLVAYGGALHIEGNGFVAAFVAGLAYGAVTTRVHEGPEMAFTDDLDRVLSLVVWFLFGALMLPIIARAGVAEVAFALVALTVVRMVPVALSLIGTGFDRATVAVIGWFGPRGLASVVFALLAFDALPSDQGGPALTAIATTVLASVILHGITAAPVARRYGAAEATATSTAD